jgi:hypothetical protein
VDTPPSVRVVSLNCPGCGAALEVGPALSQLACGYCGKVATVERSGGTIALLPMVAAIERVQVGTDRTAAELALVRLKAELAAAEHAWKAVATDFDARNPRSSQFLNGLIMLSAPGIIVGIIWVPVAAVYQNWSSMAVGAVILALSVIGLWQGAQRGARFGTRRAERLRELWAPHCARIDWLKSQLAKNREIVDGLGSQRGGGVGQGGPLAAGGVPTPTGNSQAGPPAKYTMREMSMGGRRAIGVGFLLLFVGFVVVAALLGHRDRSLSPQAGSAPVAPASQPSLPAVTAPVAIPEVDSSFRRVGGQGMMDFVVADKTLSENHPALERRMRNFCDLRRPGPGWCQVMIWVKASMVPKHLPMSDRQVNAQVAVYTRNPATGHDCFMLLRKGEEYEHSGRCD